MAGGTSGMRGRCGGLVLAAVFALAGAGALALRVAKGFLGAARFLRVAAAFFPAARGLRIFAAFLAAVRDLRVFAAFFAADFLEADFDLAMFPPPTGAASLPPWAPPTKPLQRNSHAGEAAAGLAAASATDGSRSRRAAAFLPTLFRPSVIASPAGAVLR
jgi:hypothetical protein